MQKGILVVLVLIAFLLGANLFRGNDVQAAKKYEYKFVTYRGEDSIQNALNTNASQGWELVTTTTSISEQGSHISGAIFRK